VIDDLEIRVPDAEDLDALLAFFEHLPAGERAFFKEEVLDRPTVQKWIDPAARGRRAIAIVDERVAGYVAVIPLHGWSDHVGEIRLVVAQRHRRHGVGRALARRAVLDALECKLAKLVVEVVAEQEGAVGMFQGLGFNAEGLLRDHVRDTAGRLHDLVLLAHSVQDQWEQMSAAGIVDEMA
jgi:L-amino acid N-acyltransferase YncA